MSEKITLSIVGRGPGTDAPTVDDLFKQLRDYFDLLEIVERAVAEDSESAIVWRVVHAATSSPISITVQAFARQYAVNVDARAAHVVGRTMDGLRLLEARAERPAYFTEQALSKAEAIFERVTNGLETTTINVAPVLAPDGSVSPRSESVALTPSIARNAARNVRTVLEPAAKPFKEIGSLEGYFQSVSRDGHGRRILHMKSRLTGDDVKCVVRGEAEKELEHCEIADIWRSRRIEVFGTIHFKSPARITQMDVTRIRFFKSKSELPDVNDIIDPNFTGGLRSEDYLEKLRDGDLT